MDDHRILSIEEGLDRDIERLLDVRPSAGFTARVRERAAEQRPGWSHGWLWMRAAAAGMAVLAMWVAMSRPWDGKVVPQVAHEEPNPTDVPLALRSAVAPSEVPLPIRPDPVEPVRRLYPPRADTLDHVLVSQAESSAIRRLLDAVSEGHVDLSTLMSSEALLTAVEVPLLAEVAPITVAPLSEGVAQ